MNERIERDLVRQKTSIIITICIIVMVGMIGFTYSFFAAEISSNSGEITGEVATPELNITVTKVAPTSPNANKKLIPQLDSAITKAVLGTQGKCVDDNTNAVCQVYKITLKNVGASSINVDGVVELNNGNNPNLKWARISGDGTNSVEPTVIDGIKEAEETTFVINELYTKGETKEYYIVIWISETGYSQADKGTFTGTVRFENHTESQNSVPTSAPETLAYLRSLGFEGTLSEGTPSTLLTGTTTDEGLFAMEDDQGTSYYFRGNVTNNYVKFGKYTEAAYSIYDSTTGTYSFANSCGEAPASICSRIALAGEDMYWRIIRINGDGTIRMIYDGTSPHANNESSTNRQIQTGPFNVDATGNARVGYMYGQTSATTYEETHANINDSSIKVTIDNWYLEYLNNNYGRYISNAIYCNDRSIDASNTSFTGIGYSQGNYSAYQRLASSTSVNPTLKCVQVNDRFTIQGENIETIDGLGGNQDLTYPIGLLTADEAVLSGMIFSYSGSNNSNYLYTGNNYFTNSGGMLGSGRIGNFYIQETGLLSYHLVSNSYGIRPVISLKADSIKLGDGSFDNPFSMDGNTEIISEPAEVTLTYLRSLGFEGTVSEGTPSTLFDGATTDEGLFAAEDDQGTSYYFRGAVTNNYVKFGKYTEDVYALYDENEGTSSYSSTACNTGNWLCSKIASAGDDMYWRIVRINGDGSVRMIYGGTGLYPNGGAYSLGIRTIGTSSFNSTFDDNAHVGYMYGQIDASTYEATHENINNSDVKTTIDRWYSKYLNTSYGSYIANAVYCNDRSLSGDFGTGVGKIERYTTYRFWGRTAYDPNPSLRCEQVNDRFTLQGELITGGLSSNQDLIYPIGLLTADEAIFAGGVTHNNNTNYYLNCKDSYWTGTPDSYDISDGGASVWIIDSGGMLDEATSLLSKVDGDHDVRPVISLKPDSIKFGDGTTGNPFRIEQ